MSSLKSLDSRFLKELTDVVGEKWVLTTPADLYLYSYDSALDRSVPSAVVLPGTPEQVSAVIKVLAKNKTPYVARGAATSLCGGPIPLNGAVVVAMTRLKKISKLDVDRNEIVVEPGVVNLKLQNHLAPYGLFYPPDPGSQKACTIGGNVATNAGGPHCLKYGVTSHFVVGLEVVMPEGQVHQLRVDEPGYDILGFFVGSEGTLGIATRIRLKLLAKPKHVRTMLVSFPSIEDAIQAVTDIISAGILPATLEAMDKTTVSAVEAFVHAGYPADAEAVLLIEVDGELLQSLSADVERIKVVCEKNKCGEFRFAQDEAERARLWEGRRGAYAAMARLAPNVLVEDGAVPRTKLPTALKEIKKIAADAGLKVALLFHAGDGNLHPQIIFDERNAEQTRVVKEAGYRMLKLCVDLGGTISGEHGIGIDKREAMKWLFSRETLSLFRRLKNLFDPGNLCNPDKLIPLISKAAPPKAEQKKDKEWEVGATGVVTPISEEEAIATVKKMAEGRMFFSIQGSKSKYGLRDSAVFSTTSLNQVLEVDAGNLTVTAQGGAPIEAVKQAVEKEGRFLWVSGTGTIGGILATKQSAVPPLRNLLLELRMLLPNGEVIDLGAKTMKNVAGYDAAKLVIGSWGTLGIILQATFRLYPYAAPELEIAPVTPFVFKDIHKKIKTAFDPTGLLANRMIALTADEIARQPNGEIKGPNASNEEKRLSEMGDNFWS